ncbi:hypothetical protein PoB_003872900 [Plakobranchus ocellatus]|uniref:Uncharacterized protein n=1 Tax=Plakobranchus ocellatus TaxID=259542 RepID=A0AAV4B1I4_9GAST|nr:hypothetical protein PoB_003872900 [Plakobranchus ocellatus]
MTNKLFELVSRVHIVTSALRAAQPLALVLESRLPSVRLSITFSHGEMKGTRRTRTVHNKVISCFQALCQAMVPVAGLEPVTEGSPADLRADSRYYKAVEWCVTS